LHDAKQDFPRFSTKQGILIVAKPESLKQNFSIARSCDRGARVTVLRFRHPQKQLSPTHPTEPGILIVAMLEF
jgi:hypothetical protein